MPTRAHGACNRPPLGVARASPVSVRATQRRASSVGCWSYTRETRAHVLAPNALPGRPLDGLGTDLVSFGPGEHEHEDGPDDAHHQP